MATNYVQEGGIIQYTNAGSKINAGSAIVIGNIAGVALTDIAQNATGSVAIEGVFTLPKANNLALSQGAAADLKSDGSVIAAGTAGSGGLKKCFVVFIKPETTDTSVSVKLNPGVGTAGS